MDNLKYINIFESKKEKVAIEDLVKKIRVEQPELYRHLAALIRLYATRK